MPFDPAKPFNPNPTSRIAYTNVMNGNERMPRGHPTSYRALLIGVSRKNRIGHRARERPKIKKSRSWGRRVGERGVKTHGGVARVLSRIARSGLPRGRARVRRLRTKVTVRWTR